MGAYDPDVDKLQSFCTLLEKVNSVLEAAGPGLDASGQGLIAAEPDLREALSGLRGDADVLQKDVESAERGATAALAVVEAVVVGLIGTRVPALQTDIKGLEDHCAKAAEEWADALRSQMDELQEAFDGLDAGLGVEQAEIVRWSDQVAAALLPLSEVLDDVAKDFPEDVKQALTALDEASEAAQALHGKLGTDLTADAWKLAEDLTQALETRCSGLGDTMAEHAAEHIENSRVEAEAAREMVRVSGNGLANPLEDENRQAAELVEAAGAALGQADLEFEQTHADAEAAVSDVQEIADLRTRIEQADNEVLEMKALMEVL